MEIKRKRSIEHYLSDPTFSRYYFRKPVFRYFNPVLDVSWENRDYHFSVERLTVRRFSVTEEETFTDKRVFYNRSYRLVLFLSGSTYAYGEKETILCNETTLFLMGPGQQISFMPKGPSEYSILEFYFDLIDDENKPLNLPLVDYLSLLSGMEFEAEKEVYGISKTQNEELHLRFNGLFPLLRAIESPDGLIGDSRERRAEMGARGFQLNRQILDIFSYLIDHALQRKHPVREKSDRLERVIQVMTENYARPYTISDLAEIACLSKHYFQNLFKKKYAMTPGDYLNRIRIQQAMVLLEKTSLSCKEIARTVGYADGAYFSKVFKKYAGRAPVEYRTFRENFPL
ncbi:MAG: AraC family transcriptional regulator [Spirochaetales bacterium]|nr:AraC family transcriptional regulator [Spirochaetales bacterium]